MRIFTFILTFLILSSCVESKNSINKRNNSEERYILKFIDSLKSKKMLNGNPTLVIDGFLRDYDLKYQNSLSIKKENIYSLKYIENEATKIYGSKAKYGIIILITRDSQLKKLDTSSLHEIKRIYILDDKIVSKKFIENYDRSKIKGVRIIYNQNIISEYSTEEFHELVEISTKKRL